MCLNEIFFYVDFTLKLESVCNKRYFDFWYLILYLQKKNMNFNYKIATSIFLLTITAIFFSACKKENNTPSSPVIVKYEIVSTAALKDTTVMGSIKYTDASGADQIATDFFPGYKTWTKTITLTTTTRPLTLKLSTASNYFVENSGSVTGKIYINDVEYVRSTTSIVLGNNVFFISLPEISTVLN